MIFQAFCCLCTKSWSALECCAIFYFCNKIKNCCTSTSSKIGDYFKGCYNSAMDCCVNHSHEEHNEMPEIPVAGAVEVTPEVTV